MMGVTSSMSVGSMGAAALLLPLLLLLLLPCEYGTTLAVAAAETCAASGSCGAPIAILNGVLVNEDGEQEADVYIRDGKVERVVDRVLDADAATAAMVAVAEAGSEWRVIDASGNYVMVRIAPRG